MLSFHVLEPWVVWSVSLPVVPPSLSTRKCGTAQSASHCLAHPGPLDTTLLLVLSTLVACLLPFYQSGWIFFLIPWLLDFYTVQFSGSSGYFFFLICCCPYFGSVRRQSVPIYNSILAGSAKNVVFTHSLHLFQNDHHTVNPMWIMSFFNLCFHFI